MTPEQSYEYINAFMYFIIRPEKGRGKDTLLYCSGINIDRFLPITRGRHRPMSNPAIRGLQLVNLDVRALILSRKATPKTLRGDSPCIGIISSGDSWSTEGLLIEDAPPSLPEEILRCAPLLLLKKIDKAIMLGAALPDTLPEPGEFQRFIESMCRTYGT